MSPLQRLQAHYTDRKATLLELLSLGTPIILGQLGIITVIFADTMMVGRYSTDALASASFVNNIYALFFVLGLGFTYGLTPLVAKAYTKKDKLRLGLLLRHSTSLNLCCTLILMIPLLGIYLGIEHFRLPTHLLPQVRPYFLLQLLSFLVFMGTGALKQFFDGIGKTSIPMWVILSSNILNIVGNYLLIFGKLGLPELGLFGAGLATLFSRIYMLLAFVFVLIGQRELRDIGKVALRCRTRFIYFRRLFLLGLPIGIQTGVEAGAWSIAILFVTPLGEVPLGVHQILCTLTNLGFMVYYGIGAATTILVSRAKEEKDPQTVHRIVGVGLTLAEAVALIVMCGLIVFRHHIGILFNSDPDILSMTALAILPMALYQPADALQVIYSNALRGLEDVRRMALYACCIHLLFAPCLCYILGFCIGLEDEGLQLTAIWSTFPLSLLMLGLLLYQRFRKIAY